MSTYGGFALGHSDDFLRGSTVGIGDINGDGLEDFMVTSPSLFYSSSQNEQPFAYSFDGGAYVVFGAADGPPSTELDTDIDGTNGFFVSPQFAQNAEGTVDGRFRDIGTYATGLGDVNGDGIDDFAIAGRTANYYGDGYQLYDADNFIYVIFGSNSGFGAEVRLQDLQDGTDDGSTGFAIAGVDGQLTGIQGADINGDGAGDIVISQSIIHDSTGYGGPILAASSLSADGDYSGFVIYGDDNLGGVGNGDGVVSVTALDGDTGFGVAAVRGETAYGGFSYGGFRSELTVIGDVNGDGFDDLFLKEVVPSVVEGSYTNPNTGNTYTYSDTEFTANQYLIFGAAADGVETVTPASARTVLVDYAPIDITQGEGGPLVGRFGGSGVLHAAGDINGDGFDDIAISQPVVVTVLDDAGEVDFTYTQGTVHVLFGSATGPSTTLAGDGTLDLPTDGFVIINNSVDADTYQGFGRSIAGGGDVNGDGVEDMVISAQHAYGGIDEFYLLFGRDIDGGDPAFEAQIDFASNLDVNSPDPDPYPVVDDEVGYRFLMPASNRIPTPQVSLADVNGDGLSDILIGSGTANYYIEGPQFAASSEFASTRIASNDADAFVIYGGSDELELLDTVDGTDDNTIDLANLDVNVVTGLLPIEVSLVNAGFFADFVSEGNDPANPNSVVFRLRRDGNLNETVSVDFVVAPREDSANAVSADDFVGGILPSGTVTFESGSAEATIELPINADFDREQNEDVQITISNAQATGTSPISIVGNDTAFARINNDDFPVFFSVFGSSDSEGDTAADAGLLSFTVFRSGDTAAEASIDFVLSGNNFFDGADADDIGVVTVDGVVLTTQGPEQAGNLTFAAGETQKLITLAVNPDLALEGNEGVNITISNASAVGGEDTEITRSSTNAFIFNDDFPVSLSAIGSSVTEGDGAPLTFTIFRSGDTQSEVTVDYSIGTSTFNSASNDDVAETLPVVGQVTFAAGETSQIVSVTPVDDDLIEGDERLTLTITDAVSSQALGVTGIGRTASSFIRNDDFNPEVFASNASRALDSFRSVTEGSSGNGPNTFSFFVNRRGSVDGEVVVDFEVGGSSSARFSVDSNDLLAVSDSDGTFPYAGSVTLADGQETAEITVTINNDNAAEPNESVLFSITGIDDSASADDFAVLVPSVTTTIRNDDGLPPNFSELGLEADVFGDPHIVTLDGLGYDFQAVGEYILVESADQSADDAFQVQVRFEALPGSDVVSTTTRMNVMIGDEIVEFDAKGDNELLINGTASAHDFATGPLDVDGDGEADIFFDDAAGMYLLVIGRDDAGEPNRGLSLKVNEGSGGFLNVCVFLNSGDAGNVRGLMGNADQDVSNDFALRDGSDLPIGAVDTSGAAPVPTFDFVYGDYRDSWRLTDAGSGGDNASRFTFEAGSDSASFFDADFPATSLSIDDLPADLLAAAIAAADAEGITDPIIRESAILDFALTGDDSFVLGATALAATPEVDTSPSEAPESTGFVTIAADDATILEGDAGQGTAEFTIFRTGDLSGTFALDVTLSGDLDAADGVDLETGNSVTFAAGQETATVVVNFDGDLTNENDEDIVISIAAADGGPTVAGSMAVTTVLTDDTLPELADDFFAVTEDSSFSGDLTAGNPDEEDVDAQTDTITVLGLTDSGGARTNLASIAPGALIALSGGGAIQLAEDGSFNFFATGLDALEDGALQQVTFTYHATDGNGGEASANVSVNVTGVNDAPIVANALADQSADEETAVSFAIPADAFTDADSALTLSATLANGDPLPDWLSFDGTTFAGTPPQDFNGTLEVEVSASDGEFAASDVFALEIVPVNDAPVAGVLDFGTFAEDTAVQTLNILDGVTDVDTAIADLSVANVSVTVDGAPITLPLNAEGGTLELDPGLFADALGEGESVILEIAYDIVDGDQTVANTATVEVSGLDDEPPSGFVVTTARDVVDADDGLTSLREAIALANATEGADEIAFDLDDEAVIRLREGALNISDDVSLIGNGASIDGRNQDRILTIEDGTSVDLDGLTLLRGRANSAQSGHPIDRDGGAILGGDDVSLTLTDVNLTRNRADDDGGAIALGKNGSIVMTGGSLIANRALGDDGGAFDLGYNAAISMVDVTVDGNRADDRGGVIAVDCVADIDILGGSISGNRAFLGGVVAGWDDVDVSITGTQLDDNRADRAGGVVIAYDDLTFIATSAEINGSRSMFGGAIWADDRATIMLDQTDVTNSRGSHKGGVIKVDDALSLTILGGVVSGGRTNGQGGVVFADDHADITVDGAVINNNRAVMDGGAFAVDDHAEITVIDSTLSRNRSSEDGGFIAGDDFVSVDISGSDVRINRALDGDGGVIALDRSGEVAISDSLVLNNRANGEGGVVAFDDHATFTATDSDFIRNRTTSDTGDGGVVYVDNGAATITLTNSSAIDNAAGDDGGVIGTELYYGADLTISITSTEGDEFSGNSAGDDGGVIDADDDALIFIDGVTLANNSAGDIGGIISVEDFGSVEIANAADLFSSGNSAGNNGDILAGEYRGSVSLNGQDFGGNFVFVNNDDSDLVSM